MTLAAPPPPSPPPNPNPSSLVFEKEASPLIPQFLVRGGEGTENNAKTRSFSTPFCLFRWRWDGGRLSSSGRGIGALRHSGTDGRTEEEDRVAQVPTFATPSSSFTPKLGGGGGARFAQERD